MMYKLLHFDEIQGKIDHIINYLSDMMSQLTILNSLLTEIFP